VIHLNEILLYNKQYNWSIHCSKSFTVPITIYIASVSLIVRGKKQILSVIAITSQPGTRDPKVPNAKTLNWVSASLDRSRVPGFSSPRYKHHMVLLLTFFTLSNTKAGFIPHIYSYRINICVSNKHKNIEYT